MIDYKLKYIKYKKKYIHIKILIGGHYNLFNKIDANCINISDIPNNKEYYYGKYKKDKKIKLTGDIRLRNDNKKINGEILQCNKKYIIENVLKPEYGINPKINLPTKRYLQKQLLLAIKSFSDRDKYDFFKENEESQFIIYKSNIGVNTVINKKNNYVIKSTWKSNIEKELLQYKRLRDFIPLPPLLCDELLEIINPGEKKNKIYFFATKYMGPTLLQELNNDIYLDVNNLIKLLYKIEKQIIYISNIGHYQGDSSPYNLVINNSKDVYFIDVATFDKLPYHKKFIKDKIDQVYYKIAYQMYYNIFNNDFIKQIKNVILSNIKETEREKYIKKFLNFCKQYLFIEQLINKYFKKKSDTISGIIIKWQKYMLNIK